MNPILEYNSSSALIPLQLVVDVIASAEAIGIGLIVTVVVVLTAGQPPDARVVYVTVWVPVGFVLGMIAPVLALMLLNVGDE